MAKAYDADKRLAFVRALEEGQSLLQISQRQNLSYDTCWRWADLYKKQGLNLVSPLYQNCTGAPVKVSNEMKRRAVWLKRLHRKWGGEFIRLILQKRYPKEFIPSARQLQRYFAEAGLVRLRTRKPVAGKEWAKHPHDCWQVDAKEQQCLGDGQALCWLTFTDEYTSATFAAEPFPPQSNQPG